MVTLVVFRVAEIHRVGRMFEGQEPCAFRKDGCAVFSTGRLERVLEDGLEPWIVTLQQNAKRQDAWWHRLVGDRVCFRDAVDMLPEEEPWSDIASYHRFFEGLGIPFSGLGGIEEARATLRSHGIMIGSEISVQPSLHEIPQPLPEECCNEEADSDDETELECEVDFRAHLIHDSVWCDDAWCGDFYSDIEASFDRLAEAERLRFLRR